jgi:hypothetical protein
VIAFVFVEIILFSILRYINGYPIIVDPDHNEGYYLARESREISGFGMSRPAK